MKIVVYNWSKGKYDETITEEVSSYEQAFNRIRMIIKNNLADRIQLIDSNDFKFFLWEKHVDFW